MTITIVAYNPFPTLEHGQIPILSMSGASLLEKKNNQRRTKKNFDAAEKILAGADVNQKINFHRPNTRKVSELLFINANNLQTMRRNKLSV